MSPGSPGTNAILTEPAPPARRKITAGSSVERPRGARRDAPGPVREVDLVHSVRNHRTHPIRFVVHGRADGGGSASFRCPTASRVCRSRIGIIARPPIRAMRVGCGTAECDAGPDGRCREHATPVHPVRMARHAAEDPLVRRSRPWPDDGSAGSSKSVSARLASATGGCTACTTSAHRLAARERLLGRVAPGTVERVVVGRSVRMVAQPFLEGVARGVGPERGGSIGL